MRAKGNDGDEKNSPIDVCMNMVEELGRRYLLPKFTKKYCKFRNFRENFIFVNSIKRPICDVRKSRLGHDICISVNDRVILPFHEGFHFTKLRINKTLAKISEFTVYGERNISNSLFNLFGY